MSADDVKVAEDARDGGGAYGGGSGAGSDGQRHYSNGKDDYQNDGPGDRDYRSGASGGSGGGYSRFDDARRPSSRSLTPPPVTHGGYRDASPVVPSRGGGGSGSAGGGYDSYDRRMDLPPRDSSPRGHQGGGSGGYQRRPEHFDEPPQRDREYRTKANFDRYHDRDFVADDFRRDARDVGRSSDRPMRGGYDRGHVPVDDLDYPRRPVVDYEYESRAPAPPAARGRYRSPSPVPASSYDRYPPVGRDRDSRYEMSSRDRGIRERDYVREPLPPRDRDYVATRPAYEERDVFPARDRDYPPYDDPRIDRRPVDRYAEAPRREFVRERSPFADRPYGRAPSPYQAPRPAPRDFPDREFVPRESGFAAKRRSRSFSPAGRAPRRVDPQVADRSNDIGCYCCGSFDHRLKSCPQSHQSCFFCKQKGHVNSNCPTNPRIQRCYTCGDPTHTQLKCRFRDAICNHCKRTGHIERACPELGGLKKLDEKVRAGATSRDDAVGGERNLDRNLDRRGSSFRRDDFSPRRE